MTPDKICAMGGHIPFRELRPRRIPVYVQTVWAFEDGYCITVEAPYYTVEYCINCGFEIKTPHNFEWHQLDKNSWQLLMGDRRGSRRT